ncbi:GPW/gp25 family protein [uncultured Lamprocystis sp.]|jgi:phage baseplate assembly protein W|uniref:GPW/gp25 family protein n=1 Tax=uncultured Lamprocystis sp. TaxID=543132 RepID=UPI0025D06BAE|nr:GPW/gp25 family protein [uncultured Lamprocystis sp.]
MAASNLRYPYQIDGHGRTAGAGEEDYIRGLIEQVLFTSPGERVMRPDFGSGVMQLVFAPNSAELAATTQFLVQAALQQYLGNLIALEGVEIESDDSTLRVIVRYAIRRTGVGQVAEFARDGGVP